MTTSVRGWLLLGIVVGLVSSFSCGTAARCTPSSCPAGCCDSSGTCQPGNSNNQCGTLGNACSTCALGQNCQFGTCATSSSGGGNGSGGGTGGAMGGGSGGGSMGGSAGGGSMGGGGGTGGGGGGALCGPQSCSGCCSNGSCVTTPNNLSDATCGLAGNACANCTSSAQICDRGICFGGTGGGTGGGSGGGTGGGSMGGGGGSTCTGCLLPSGACVPAGNTSVINCGSGGARCVACASGELCQSGTCTTPVGMKRVGDACASDNECIASLGAAAICKLFTSAGNGSYSGGYCTLRCPASSCPTGSTCVGLNPAYGEEALCWDNCSATDRCRTPGYGCYGLSSGSACWISPLPPLDAGTPANKVGNACTSDAQCINPPENGGVCLMTQFNFTWPQGYCSKQNCITNDECSSDGGALCIGFSTTEQACVRRCADSRDGGQSTCRPNYRCNPYIIRQPDGGQMTSTDGFCVP